MTRLLSQIFNPPSRIFAVTRIVADRLEPWLLPYGRTAYLVATCTDADCSVGYYGVNIDHYLAEADNISNPLMLHIAANDELCEPEARERIVRTLKNCPRLRCMNMSAGHAFALVEGIITTKRRCCQRSYEFLAHH